MNLVRVLEKFFEVQVFSATSAWFGTSEMSMLSARVIWVTYLPLRAASCEEKNWRLRREQSNEDALGRKRLWEATAPCTKNLMNFIEFLHISTMLGIYRRSKLEKWHKPSHIVSLGWRNFMLEWPWSRMNNSQIQGVLFKGNCVCVFFRQLENDFLWLFIWGTCD